MEYDNCRAAMGMLTEIFDTETVKWERRKPFPLALLKIGNHELCPWNKKG